MFWGRFPGNTQVTVKHFIPIKGDGSSPHLHAPKERTASFKAAQGWEGVNQSELILPCAGGKCTKPSKPLQCKPSQPKSAHREQPRVLESPFQCVIPWGNPASGGNLWCHGATLGKHLGRCGNAQDELLGSTTPTRQTQTFSPLSFAESDPRGCSLCGQWHRIHKRGHSRHRQGIQHTDKDLLFCTTSSTKLLISCGKPCDRTAFCPACDPSPAADVGYLLLCRCWPRSAALSCRGCWPAWSKCPTTPFSGATLL